MMRLVVDTAMGLVARLAESTYSLNANTGRVALSSQSKIGHKIL